MKSHIKLLLLFVLSVFLAGCSQSDRDYINDLVVKLTESKTERKERVAIEKIKGSIEYDIKEKVAKWYSGKNINYDKIIVRDYGNPIKLGNQFKVPIQFSLTIDKLIVVENHNFQGNLFYDLDGGYKECEWSAAGTETDTTKLQQLGNKLLSK